MHKKLFVAFLGSVAGLILFNCSSLDQQTGIGSDIIKDTDPSFMDFNGNFFALSLDSSDCIDTTYSLPGTSAGSGFGQHAGRLATGTSGKYKVYSYLEFLINHDFVQQFNSTYEFDSITFMFDTLSDTALPEPEIPSTDLFLNACNKNSALHQEPGGQESAAICTLTRIDTLETIRFTGRLSNVQFADSIFNRIQELLSCDSSEKYCDSAFSESFFVSLFTSQNSFLWFKNTTNNYPAMVLHTHYKDKDSTRHSSDTLRGYPTMVVSEPDSLSEANETMPVMSWLPGRIAVFKLDLKPLWDTMDSTGFNELLSAGFVARTELLETENDDTIPPVNYFLSAKKVTDIETINTLFDTINAHYNNVVNLHAPSETKELILPIDYRLQYYINGSQRYFYLYTRLVSRKVGWKQQVLWSNPRFKAVLTTIN